MPSSVTVLRNAIKEGTTIALVPSGADIAAAEFLALGSQQFSLDEETGFVNQEDGVNEKLRAIYQCWLHHDSTTTEYLADCEAKKVAVVNFMERTELLAYLSGTSETCEYLKGEVEKEEKSKDKKEESNKRQKIIDSDPFLKLVLGNEREAVDHNKALRGSKLADFLNVAKECEYKIIRPGKKASSSGRSHRHGSERRGGESAVDTSLAAKLRHKEPIIILSPSASALINMNNVQAFLQDGKFVDPAQSAQNGLSGGPNMLQIVRNSRRFNRKVKFVVVSDVDKFFTKPEHWDRVVAVFTTGQQWQFKNYRDSQPNSLFQKVKGFYVHYNGDPVPDNIQSWNLEVVPIERTRRFKDRQTSEYMWEVLERFMAGRGV